MPVKYSAEPLVEDSEPLFFISISINLAFCTKRGVYYAGELPFPHVPREASASPSAVDPPASTSVCSALQKANGVTLVAR